VRKLKLLVSCPLEVGEGWGTVATISAILAKCAVDKLLLGVVAKHASELAEAGLDSSHAGKSHTAPTITLVLHRAHVAYMENVKITLKGNISNI
jgi:uncharacterized protein involved in propanediol utilization